MVPTGNTQRNKLIAGTGLVVVTALIIGGVIFFSGKPSENAVTAVPAATPAPSSSGGGSNNRTYKDGTYTATGSYSSPGGTESIKVTLTIANDTVTAASVTGDAKDSDSKEYQDMFIRNYKDQVVGRSVDSISLSRVSGSSLTSDGFNDALKQIKSAAQV
jgi:uncharacterized protein with FMN-binding domain